MRDAGLGKPGRDPFTDGIVTAGKPVPEVGVEALHPAPRATDTARRPWARVVRRDE